ncbi:MAG TPA: TetR/AcrR family transcriptional regulator [Burkholderiaceae bacterium]|nr:TetR/AcrR family transcriptional regulator [Burkholderiaceae bacterium]
MAIRDELKSFKKERILEEAERLFYERGFRGTSMDAIAESLDMTKPFVYGAYERKVDILVDIYLRAVNRSLETIRQAREAGGSPTQQLRRFALRFTGVVIANQPGTAVFFREESSIPQETLREINALKGRFDDELAALIADGVAAGEFSVADPRTATLAIGGMISWAYVWYRKDGRLQPDDIGAHMAAYALRLAGVREPGG